MKADPTGRRRTPAAAALVVSWPQAPADKPPGREDALGALTWVFSRLSLLGWQTNAFFQHRDVFLRCLCLSVALASQYFCSYPLFLFPTLLPSSSVLQSFHFVSAVFQSVELLCPRHPGLILLLPVTLSVYHSTG